jgi:hypothetical protein
MLFFIVINLFMVFWLGLILDGFRQVLAGEDPLLLIGILAASGAFLVVGLGLLLLSRFYPVSGASRALPFIAFVLLGAITLLNVTVASLWAGVVVSGILIAATVITSVMNLIAARTT